jgi:hypothetical protein
MGRAAALQLDSTWRTVIVQRIITSHQLRSQTVFSRERRTVTSGAIDLPAFIEFDDRPIRH